jgi:hypothetical protein
MLDLPRITATSVLNAHINGAGLGKVWGCAWPCERVVLAEHSLAALRVAA